MERGGEEVSSTKNWWCVLESYCRTQPVGRGRDSSSMLRRVDGEMPLRVLGGTSRWVGFEVELEELAS